MKIQEKIKAIRKNEKLKDIQMTGFNRSFAFRYFELLDFIEIIEELESEQKLFSSFSITTKGAILKIIDLESEETFETTMEVDNFGQLLKGKNMHPFQEFGAAVTYYKKCLYINLYNLKDTCAIDSDTRITPGQYEEINRLVISTNTSLDKLLESEKIIVSLEEITKKQGFTLLEKLLEKDRKIKKKSNL